MLCNVVVVAVVFIRELKQGRKRRRGRYQVKNEFIFEQRNSQFSRSVQYPNGSKSARAKYAMTAFNSKWKDEKLAVVVHVPRTTPNMVIPRPCCAEYGKGMYNKRAQLLFCSLNLLFGDVLVATVVVVCLSTLSSSSKGERAREAMLTTKKELPGFLFLCMHEVLFLWL